MRVLIALVCLLVLSNPVLAAPQHVIVIALENKDATRLDVNPHDYIYDNLERAPYLNGVLSARASRASNFVDELLKRRSQPHYILMEAGTSQFDDTRFKCDNDPGKSCDVLFGPPNWTSSGAHLTAQIEAARNPALTWMTYQEGLDPKKTGSCPIHSSGLYAAKHNPFVYFSDIAGSPPAGDNANCAAHTRDLSRFAADMASGSLANYVFVTPNLCNDMHGAGGCEGDDVEAGDRFLRGFLPPLLDWADRNKAVVFLVWDEGSAGKKLPFYAVGWGVKKDYESRIRYSHGSMLKTIERIFGLPVLDAVKEATDLADMFEPGILPPP